MERFYFFKRNTLGRPRAAVRWRWKCRSIGDGLDAVEKGESAF